MIQLNDLPAEYLEKIALRVSPKYELVRVVGEGKNGLVFEAKGSGSDFRYCLKTVRPNFSETDLENAREKIESEVKILSPLDHNCIQRVFDFSSGEEIPYLVSNLFSGKTFYEFRQSGKKLKFSEGMYVIRLLVNVFEYIHENGRVHCDAHQDNIMIADNVFAGGIMLIDFGSGHRRTGTDPVTEDRGAVRFKPVDALPRHQNPVKREAITTAGERYDLKAFGLLLAYMQIALFSDASARQIQEYLQLAGDIESGRISTWKDVNERLNFVFDPYHLVTRVDRFFDFSSHEAGGISIPITGNVETGSKLKYIIDTANFQRLKNIKQLSFCEWQYPGATHNRFEHSLGVFSATQKAIDKLCFDNSFYSLVSENEVVALTLSSLLHDIGHYPFAHVMEHYVASRYSDDKELKNLASHTVNSVHIVRNDADISRLIVDNFGGEVLIEVDNIITGNRRKIAGIIDGTIDCDKIDYLKRDSYHCGVPFGQGYDSDNIIRSMHFNRSKGRISFDKNYSSSVEGFLLLQCQMLKDVYWHQNVRGVFAMFHRFIDVCIRGDREKLARLINEMKVAKTEDHVISNVFSRLYSSIEKSGSLSENEKHSLMRMLHIHSEPRNINKYELLYSYSHGDELPSSIASSTSVFDSIVARHGRSTLDSSRINWRAVGKLRESLVDALNMRRVEASNLDVLIDIPWGKSSVQPVEFIDRVSGKEYGFSQYSHISDSIFSELSIFAAPIRIFVSPSAVELIKFQAEALERDMLDKYFNTRTGFPAS